MLKVDSSFLARTLALALILALAGFTYATSTESRGLEASTGIGARAVGSSAIRFTNAFLLPGGDAADPLPDTFDLGLACYGSQMTRYITMVGGIRPYVVTSTTINPILPAQSTLALRPSGLLSGIVLNGAPAAFNFSATVTDTFCPTSIQQLGNFRLTLVTLAPGDFRFAVSRINNGSVGLHYIAKLDAIGGIQPVRFTILPNTLQVNGVFKGNTARLESLGLSLADDGTIFGRPLETGTVTFTARAEDAGGKQANDTTGTVRDQQVTFTISDNSVVQTDFASFNVTVKGETAKLGRDSVKFNGQFNVGNLKNLEVNGFLFAFRIGGATYEGRFDKTGKVVSVNTGRPLKFADGSTMKAKVDLNSGQISGQISKASLVRAVDAVNIENLSTKRIAMGITISDIAAVSDTLDFSTRRVGDKYQLDYKIGKVGQSLGGSCHILSVNGNDGSTTAGQDGTAWRVRFIAIPRFGLDAAAGTDLISSASVKIGANFSQAIPGTSLLAKNGKLTFSDKQASGEKLVSLSYDTVKFTGEAKSLPLTQSKTGIPVAKSFPPPPPAVPGGLPGPDPRANDRNFTFGFELARPAPNASFKGEGAKQVTPRPNKGVYVDNANGLN